MSKRPESFDDLEAVAQDIGQLIGEVVPRGQGFALLVFTMGDTEPRGLTYVSNACREDMVKALRECAITLEAGMDTPPGEPFINEH